ncbi:MAG TPA: 2'-5' RNA ligase family protein [Thermoplasmata archaeon]|nr:2'-5' RNA ligase family protein [Thermoplasmata archaeon]
MPAPGLPSRAHGVVSLLGPSDRDRVIGIWQGIEHRLGLRGIWVMPYPHFSYQIAGEYDEPGLEAALERLAATTAPFEVRTSGVATFGPPWPVVYLAVEKSPGLEELHDRIARACAPHARELSEYYVGARWTPHVSLAYGNEADGTALTAAEVDAVLALLGRGAYRWTLRVDNLAFVRDEGTVQRPVRTFPLRAV